MATAPQLFESSRIRVRALGALDVRDIADEPLDALLAQPKRVALFVYLVLGDPHAMPSRDKLCALFWPDAPAANARLSLRQALHFIRRACGDDVVRTRGSDEIGIVHAAIRSDVTEFVEAIESNRLRDALAIYRGPLLQEFTAAGVSTAFEWWLERERARLHAIAVRAADLLTNDAERRGDLRASIAFAREALRLSPFDEPALRRLVSFLEQSADVGGALREYAEFEARMSRELESAPSAETRALIERLRGSIPTEVGQSRIGILSNIAATATRPPTPEPQAPSGTIHRSWLPRGWRSVAGIAATTLLLGFGGALALHSRRSDGGDVDHAVLASPGSVGSESLVARRFYDAGIAAYREHDFPSALRLFRAALAEDSTFAMAADYAGLSEWTARGPQHVLPYMAQAVRVASHATPHDRLFAQTMWATSTNDPSAVALAESLSARYPRDLRDAVLLAENQAWSGDRRRAIETYRRVIERDAALNSGALSECYACDANRNLIEAYVSDDSLRLAESVAHDWTARQPSEEQAWSALARVYEAEGRLAEAMEAQREASRRAGRELVDITYRARLAIRGGDFRGADQLLTSHAADGSPSARIDVLWWLAISLRNQGRFAEAIRTLDRSIAIDDSTRSSIDHGSSGRMARAWVLAEAGKPREAAAVFELIAATAATDLAAQGITGPGVIAKRRAWTLSLAAAAYAAAGDTSRLESLADTIDVVARPSAFGRDRRLSSFVRGLLYEARGDLRAAERSYRSAIYSATNGLPQIPLGLARVLVGEGRRSDAVHALEPVLHGDLEGSAYYATRTSLERALERTRR